MIILGRRVLEFVGTGESFRAVYADEVSPVSHTAVGLLDADQSTALAGCGNTSPRSHPKGQLKRC
jgi:hypothetical protein